MTIKETLVKTNGFEVRFAVYDNGEWLVSISNDFIEKGASSMPCNGNWNKGLADAVDNISNILTYDELTYLFNGLLYDKNIDNSFMQYLKNDYDPCMGCRYEGECERECNPCRD